MIIKLEKLNLFHARGLKQIINNKEIRWYGKLYDSYPLSKVKKYIRKQLKIKKYYEFAILANNIFVGTISIEKIDKINKNASIGYWVAKSYRGKGIATKSVKLVTKFGFDKLKLKRIYATVRQDNTASIKVLERAGFKREGLLRKSVFSDGKFYNEYIYGIVR